MFSASRSDRVLVGWIRRPIGLKGELAIEPSGDDPHRFDPGHEVTAETDPPRILVVERNRPYRGGRAVRFVGIDTVDAAEALRGVRMTVAPEALPALPPGTYYHYQVLGLMVVDADGVLLGRVESIMSTGANDVYCVGSGAEEIMIAAVPVMIDRVDIEAGRICLTVAKSALGEDEPPI